MVRALALAVLLSSSLLAPVRAGAQETPELRLRDRIVAVVDEDPILASEVDRAITLGLEERREGEGEEAFRRRLVDALIDQRVRFHEVTRFGIEQVPVSQIEEQVEAIRARFESREEFERRLRDVGLDVAALRQLVARQLRVWIYFEEFLGPRVFVSLDDVRQYYDETFVPAVEERGQAAPPVEEVREEIRRILNERRLNEAIENKTDELRREADVVNYFDSEHETLPPTILEIGEENRGG